VLAELGKHFDLRVKVERHPGRSLDVPRSTFDIIQAQRVLGRRSKLSLSDGLHELVGG